MYQFDIGYSSLFFYHLQEESIRLTLSQYWLIVLAALVAIAGADWVLRRVLAPHPSAPRTARAFVLAVVMLAFGVRCTFVLARERGRVQEDFAVASFVMNWRTYLEEQNRFTGSGRAGRRPGGSIRRRTPRTSRRSRWTSSDSVRWRGSGDRRSAQRIPGKR